MSFIHLQTHSQFSLLEGTATVEKLVEKAASLGMKSLALTDSNRMSGLVLFQKSCLKHGIKPILGTELSHPDDPEKKLVLLAKNKEGYSDICELITERQLDPENFSFDKSFIRFFPNLFFLTSHPKVLEQIAQTANKKSLYGILNNHNRSIRQRSRILEFAASKIQVPLVVTNDVYFLHKQDWEIHKILRAIDLNSTLSRLTEEEYVSHNCSFKSEEEMLKLFPNHREAVYNTEVIADQCVADLDIDENWILPEITPPDGLTSEEYLRKLALEGLEKNYGGTDQYQQAKEIQLKELRVIHKLKYDSYFLMVKSIRDEANREFHRHYRKHNDCTLLRGSAANSITFYNIGASDLDPIKYDLYFERFLNEERAAPPDADIDFGWDERDRIFQFFENNWGQDRVAVVCTTNHFKGRAAFREVAKVFGFSEEQISQLLEYTHELDPQDLKSYEIQRIMFYARKIQGMPRFLGQHCGGIIVTNQPIYRHVACERSGGDKNRIITQIDMHNGLDELGLIKFDILGNGSLSVLRDTLEQIAEQGFEDPEVHSEAMVQEDEDVKHLIANGETRGIFYIESPAQIRLNMKAQTTCFEDIGITSSLIRPAGTAYTSTFVERHRKHLDGVKDWEFLHSSLEKILGETHDVIAYQEDIIRICHEVAGMPLRRADRVRKMMNSAHEGAPDDYDAVEKEFLEGCIAKNNYTMEQAQKLWERINSFTGFSFCKSHSLSYAQLSFKCAYLKCRYPAQFLAAVISNGHGFYSHTVYIQEALRFDIKLQPVHINHSLYEFKGVGSTLVPGFMHVRNLRKTSIDNIVMERMQNGPFSSFENLMTRTDLGKKDLEALIKVGACDELGLNQPQMLYVLNKNYGKKKSHSSQDLFQEVSQGSDLPPLKDFSFAQKCLNETELLGYMISADALSILDLHPCYKIAAPCAHLNSYVGKRIRLFGWPITSRAHAVTDGGVMKFLTLQDRSGYADVIFWPEALSRCQSTLLRPGPFLVEGKVQEEQDTYVLIADTVKNVHWSPGQVDFQAASDRLAVSYDKYKHMDKYYARTAA